MLIVSLVKRLPFKQYFHATSELLPIFKSFLLYSGGTLFLRSSPILVSIMTMSILSPDHFGILALVNSFVNIACIVCGFGLRQVLSLEYFHCSFEQKKTTILEIVTTYLLLSIPLFCVGILFHNWIRYYYFMNQISSGLLFLSFVFIFLYFFSELVYQVLQYERQSLLLTKLQVSASLAIVGTNYLLLGYTPLGITSVMASQIAGALMVSIVGMRYGNHYIKTTKINISSWPTAVKKYLTNGVPFIPGMLFSWIIVASNRVILARYATLHDVGIYSIANLFGQIFFYTVLMPFSDAYLPYVMKKFSENTSDLMSVERWNRTVMWLFLPSLFVCFNIGFFVAKPLIIWLLPPSYHEAMPYIWLMLLGYLLSMASYFPAALIQFKRKTAFIASALCVPAITNILLNIALIPRYNITGCALATIFSYLLHFLLVLAYNHRISKSL